MFRRAFAATALMMAASHATAACVGTSYFDLLDESRLAEIDAAASALPYSEGLIWNATRDGQSITVIGTMHIYDPRLDPIYDMIAADITAAELVLLEATPDDQRALEALLADDPAMVLITQGPTLPDLLDDETWALLSAASTDRGVPGFMAAQMQPWYLSLVLAIPPCAMADLASGIQGLDGMISDLALENDVPLAALESYMTLFDFFQTGTMDDQIDMLRLSLISPETQQQQFVAMLDSYFSGRIGRLWEMSRQAVNDLPGLDPETGTVLFAEMENALLYQRNRDWMPVIAQAMEDHDRIVTAFGAAHLIGDDGVLQLLENDGWDLQRRY